MANGVFLIKMGEEIIPLKYDNYYPFYNDFARVKTGNKWSIIDKNGRELNANKL